MQCIFCEIAEKKLKTHLIYEDSDTVAFKDINPQAPIHILIIPKKHIPSLQETVQIDANVLSSLMLAARNIAALQQCHDKGYRIVINTGEDGGQTVSHLHLHFLAGKQLSWPPG